MNDFTLKGVPIFRIKNVQEAKLFYIDYLGFKLDWEHYYEKNAPVYMQVSKNELVLYLSENQRFNKGIIIYVSISNLDSLHHELCKKSNYQTPSVLTTQWNTKQMEILDPFDNLLRFNEEPA